MGYQKKMTNVIFSLIKFGIFHIKNRHCKECLLKIIFLLTLFIAQLSRIITNMLAILFHRKPLIFYHYHQNRHRPLEDLKEQLCVVLISLHL